jgi:hypothetical protein
MSTSPYLLAAYLGSAALYGGYLAHLLRRRRVLAGALAERETALASRPRRPRVLADSQAAASASTSGSASPGAR